MKIRLLQCISSPNLYHIQTKPWWRPWWSTVWVNGEYRFEEKEAIKFANFIANPVIIEVRP